MLRSLYALGLGTAVIAMFATCQAEPTFEGRSASEWGKAIAGSDPVQSATASQRLCQGADEALPVVHYLAASAQARVRVGALGVLHIVVDRRASGTIGPELDDVLARAAAFDDERTRTGLVAIRGSLALDADSASAALSLDLSDTRPAVRRAAFERLRRLPPERLDTASLDEVAASTDGEAQLMAAALMLRSGTASAQLVAVLGAGLDRDEPLPSGVLAAIGGGLNAPGLSAVVRDGWAIRLIETRARTVQLAVLESLAFETGETEWSAPLHSAVRALVDDTKTDEDIRLQGIRALIRVNANTRDDLDRVVAALSRSRGRIRLLAAKALLDGGDDPAHREAAIEALVLMLADSVSEYAVQAAAELLAAGEKHADALAALQSAAGRGPRETSYRARQALLRSMAGK